MWRSTEGQTGRGVTKASDIFSFGLVVRTTSAVRFICCQRFGHSVYTPLGVVTFSRMITKRSKRRVSRRNMRSSPDTLPTSVPLRQGSWSRLATRPRVKL
ncbi:hypothetical protein EV126DRAFT_68428 [Verticillium dahliae]|nr:hypothetical protein EV126DRAFT_68428 [Verticillium dahliae]